ncbi:REP-associated tyrosine transposase [Methylomicrobium lacus]|uniref:REP-associated tyrosine transposase n=1 Tax=Methylomicrobium lacus TaxID=136992 RepID=UPI001FE0E4A3|nr:transposase [Methylomicrobium lacus]
MTTCNHPFSSRDVGVAPTGSTLVEATPTSRLKKPKPDPHSQSLRKGRRSIPNQIYLITTTTQDRVTVFSDFYAARALICLLHTDPEAKTLAFVVMPDHLHWLMQLGQIRPLSQVVASLKTLSAKKIGKPLWQEGYHDHALRQEEDLRAVARYIVANPLRAGLVTRIGDYPHWDSIWL